MQPIRTLFTVMLLALTLMGAAAGEQAFSVSKVSEDSAVRSDVRPIHVGFYDASANRTFVAWMGANSHPVVKQFDHASGTWSADRVVARSPFVDKHNYPALLKGPDGRLFAFYGCHNTPLKLAISPERLSIEGQWSDQTIAEAAHASYPAPVLTTSGTFYCFYRETRKSNGHSDDRPYDFVKSTDLGKTWTHQRVIDPYPRTTDNMCEVYNGKVSYQPAKGGVKERIHIAWTICGEKAGRHAHATYGRNVYYAYVDPANDHVYNVAGKDLGAHVDNVEADQHCLVLDTSIPEDGHAAGLQVSAHYRDDGRPLILFDNRNAGGLGSATWDGGKWVFALVEKAGGEPRELEKIGPQSFLAYRPKGEAIAVFKTTDGGASWSREPNDVHVGQRVDRVFAIDSAHPDAKLLIIEGGDQTLERGTRDVFIGRVTAQQASESPAAPPRVTSPG